MDKIGKSALILWICAGVALVGGIGCFTTSVGAGVFGIVLAGVLAFIGYRQYIKHKQEQERKIAEEAKERERQLAAQAEAERKKAEAAAKAKADEEAKKRNEAKFETLLIKVAGVSFDNDNGQSRQTILKKLKSKIKTDIHPDEIELKKEKHKGNDAIAVLVDGLQIGNIPAESVPYLIENWGRIYDVSWIEVYGGGFNNITEETKNFGAEITVRLLREVKA